jgi:hypothetical protein
LVNCSVAEIKLQRMELNCGRGGNVEIGRVVRLEKRSRIVSGSDMA